MSGEAKPYRIVDDGLRLAVRLTPRASADRIDGIGADADGRALLLVRLKAPPVEGAANSSLISFIARAMDIRKADVSIHSGETGRTKMLHLSGDGFTLATRLEILFAGKA